MEKKIKPSDLRAEAQRLIKAGKMPSIDQLMGVVSEIRQKYHSKIANARTVEKPQGRRCDVHRRLEGRE